ncbi:MAG TPA: transglycosylase domain-containing protein, partial [Terriglobales bacterium]
MAIKLKIPRRQGKQLHLSTEVVRAIAAGSIIILTVLFGVFAYYYVKYQKIVDAKMRGQIFNNAAKIYAAPYVVKDDAALSISAAVSRLRKAGYSETGERFVSKTGTYHATDDSIEVKPGPESYHTAEGALIHVKNGKVDRISSLGSGSELGSYELEPELITGLFDRQDRAKRRLITYEDMPKVLVDAIISIEDRRFFQHNGINFYRLAAAMANDVIHPDRRRQGGGTLTMQLARQPGFFVSRERTVKRKLSEMLIAVELEQRLSKKQILELYVNSADMGQRGSFDIRGFGEGAQAYFGKDIKALTLPEAALLAGIVNGPSYYSPYRHPDRALERRNLVLEAMYETGAITRQQADQAKAIPLKLAPPNVEASDAPYFVDMLRDQLLSNYSESDLNDRGYRIYTTLSPELQKFAADAIEVGMKQVDALVLKQRTKKIKIGKGKSAHYETKVLEGPKPQVALVALDPHTGQVLALSGGRNYGFSQLNHAIATRPTGSIFKPLVFAAAVESAVDGSQQVFTPSSLVDDVPTVFQYEDKIYTPKNFRDEYHGTVSASYALAHSLNNATVKLAEMVGYQKVADLAKTAGIKSVRATPAMALGSYDASPMDMAGVYTMFANGGVRVSPILLNSIRDSKGDVVEDYTTDKKPILDPRVDYVITKMLEGVMNYG